MQQCLHLLIVDRDRREALATRCGSRWLLPMLCGPERIRAGLLVSCWIAERGLGGAVIGQWLGRVSSTQQAMDWLVIVDARRSARAVAPPHTGWTPLECLKSSPS